MFDALYAGFAGLIANISNFMYSYLLIILLLAAGIYFTCRSKFVQLRLLGESIRVVSEKSDDEHAVSAFEALMVSTASRVGTGNIVGVANAIAIGGYGSVFWMWLIALVGGATAFVESTLAQIYKKRDEQGGSYGGPSYYIQAALKSRFLGVVFAVALVATYAGGFNMLASFNLIDSMSNYSFYAHTVTLMGRQFALVPVLGGALLAILVGICIMGSGKRIVKVTGVLVPVMGVLYIIMAVIVMVLNIGMLPQVLQRIFSAAFDVKAIFGGAAGFGSSAVMQGIKRGLYSNEAGVGSAPNAAASANVSHPVKQGLVQMLSVFLDTLVICSATAFMLLCSGVEPAVELQGAPYVQSALAASFGTLGPVFITVAMVLFAFTTLIGNLYYVDNALAYLLGHVPSKRFMVVFRLIAMGLIFLGAGLTLDLVWNLSDVLMGVMVLINIPVIAVLSRPAAAALRNYTEQRRAGKNPVFRAADIGLKEKTEYWN